MERVPSVQEEFEKRPSFGVATIILWDELDGAIRDIARGPAEVSPALKSGMPKTFASVEVHRKEVENK